MTKYLPFIYIIVCVSISTVWPPIFLVMIVSLYIYDWNNKRQPVDTDTILDDIELASFLAMKKEYLLGPIWRHKKLQALQTSDFKCQKCGTKHRLEGHHTRDYGLIPHEPVSSIAILCRDCHQDEHDKHGYPQTLQDYKSWNKPI